MNIVEAMGGVKWFNIYMGALLGTEICIFLVLIAIAIILISK